MQATSDDTASDEEEPDRTDWSCPGIGVQMGGNGGAGAIDDCDCSE